MSTNKKKFFEALNQRHYDIVEKLLKNRKIYVNQKEDFTFIDENETLSLSTPAWYIALKKLDVN